MFKKIMIMGLFTFINSVNIIASQQETINKNNAQTGVAPAWDTRRNQGKESDMVTQYGGDKRDWDEVTQFTPGMSIAEIIAMRQKAQAAAASASAQEDKKANNTVNTDSKD